MTISAPPSSDVVRMPATNLLEHLDNRSNHHYPYPPVMDAAGNTAAYYSCYMTTKAELASLGHQMVISFNL